MKITILTYLAIPMLAISVVGCGNAKSGGSDAAAIQQFVKDSAPHVTAINKAFTDESSLVTQMSLKKVSYDAFKKSYDESEATLKTEVQAVSNVAVKDGVKDYKNQYVTLLNQGAQLMQDQENAMNPSGTMDAKKAANIKTELDTFVAKYKELSARYGTQ